MSRKTPIGVGVIGLGFMGRTHIAAYQSASKDGYACKLVAVCDTDSSRLCGSAAAPATKSSIARPAGEFDPKDVHTYEDVDAFLTDPAIQLVSVCTHTESHVDLTLRALAAGKHVLVEKPLAIRSQDARRVTEAAAKSKSLCMPAMCMRFWPGWSWLKERIEDNAYGAIRSAVFERLASPPGWAPDFYRDPARTGGALIDLHIHDADFILWCFGKPDAVSSTGTVNHLTTLYRYRNGPAHVVAEGGWDHTPGFPFKMRFVVTFERATAEFDSGREPPLLVATDGQWNAVPLNSITGWDYQVRYFLTAIEKNHSDLEVKPSDAEAVLELLEAERRSLESGACVELR